MLEEKKQKAICKALGKPRTALELADKLGVSKPTAYNYIRALRKAKVPMSMGWRRQGSTGPEARTYVLA